MTIITTEKGRRRSIQNQSDIERRFDLVDRTLQPRERALLTAMLDTDPDPFAEPYQELLTQQYRTPPVSMEQFLEDPFYMGDTCESLYPELRADLIELFRNPYRECLLTGGIGTGKTMVLSVAICRILYELSCLHNPQRTFGLSPGSEIVIPLISRNLVLAREILKTSVDDKLKESPYFMQHFFPDMKREYTMFPHNIRMIIASYGAERVLGGNTVAIAMDESNFPPKRKGQHISTAYGQRLTTAHFDIVEKVYRSMVRRIKSRFQNVGGDFPGMVILASSAATVDSFTERKIRECREDPMVFVRDHTPWTVKPGGTFSGEKFWVLCSRSAVRARIMTDEEVAELTDEYMEEHDVWAIDVPVEFRDDFESDIENALREIAGISTQAISAYLQRLEAIEPCVVDRPHPFSLPEWTVGGPGDFRWDVMCRQVQRRLTGGFTEDAWLPKLSPKALRWAHVDTSLSGDSSAICVGHVDRWVEVVRRDERGEKFVDSAPFYVLDLILRLNPPPGEQIYMPEIRRLVYSMLDHGYQFIGFSTDSYQYAEMHQQIRRHGISPRLISMDKTTAAYDELKSAIYERRVEFYRYEPFISELKALEYDRNKGKVDHPVAGSKDVCDSVAGVVYGLLQAQQRLPIGYTDDVEHKVRNPHAWVSDKIPADKIRDGVVEGDEDENEPGPDELPFLVGD